MRSMFFQRPRIVFIRSPENYTEGNRVKFIIYKDSILPVIQSGQAEIIEPKWRGIPERYCLLSGTRTQYWPNGNRPYYQTGKKLFLAGILCITPSRFIALNGTPFTVWMQKRHVFHDGGRWNILQIGMLCFLVPISRKHQQVT